MGYAGVVVGHGPMGPHKTLYNRFVRCSAKGVFEKIFAELAQIKGDDEEVLMIDATYLKAHGFEP